MGRDALADRALRGGLDEDSDIAVRVNVDETRSDVLPGCVDRSDRLRTTGPADLPNLPFPDSDICRLPRRARTVEDASSLDADVERHLLENARSPSNVVPGGQ